MRHVLCTLLVTLVAGCGEGTDWDGQWADAHGRPVPEDVITSYPGPEHCDWESSAFLVIGRPLATAPRMYVRDPQGLFTEYLTSAFLDDAELPHQARFTGYERDGAELWMSPGAADHAFIVRGDDVERWPRAKEFIACA